MSVQVKKTQNSGYIALLRGTTELVVNKKLNYSEYGFYVLLVMLCHWDIHKPVFGCITKSPIELAEALGCDRTTVDRKIEKLLKVGLIEWFEDNLRVNNYVEFTLAGAKKAAKKVSKDNEEISFSHYDFSADLQDSRATLQEIVAKVQETRAELQNIPDEKDLQSFKVPFKVNLSLDNNGSISDSDQIAEDFENWRLKQKEN